MDEQNEDARSMYGRDMPDGDLHRYEGLDEHGLEGARLAHGILRLGMGMGLADAALAVLGHGEVTCKHVDQGRSSLLHHRRGG